MEITSQASLNSVVDDNAACAVLFAEDSDSQSKQYLDLLPELIDEFESVKFAKVNVSTHPDVASAAKVTTFPRVLFFLRGSQWTPLKDLSVPVLIKRLQELTDAASTKIDDRLRKLVSQRPIMLFMKGSPSNPCCGFSRQIIDLLAQAGVRDFGHFDILSDEEVRQGLKVFSNWPTFPQLYSQGQLIGGVDIVRELVEENCLLQELNLAYFFFLKKSLKCL